MTSFFEVGLSHLCINFSLLRDFFAQTLVVFVMSWLCTLVSSREPF